MKLNFEKSHWIYPAIFWGVLAVGIAAFIGVIDMVVSSSSLHESVGIEKSFSRSLIEYDPNLVMPNKDLPPFLPKISKFGNLKWRTEKIIEKNKYADINLEFPQFIGGYEVAGLNSYIRGIVVKEINDDKNTVSEWIADKNSPYWDETCGREFTDDALYECSVQLKSLYQVSAIINDIVSTEIIFTDFTGGGNGNHDEPVVLNYDLKSNRAIYNSDLLCETIDFINFSDNLFYAMNSFMRTPAFDWEGVFNTNFGPENGGIDEINKDIGNLNYFGDILLGYTGINIIYPPYALTSGAFGITRIPIPYSILGNALCLP